MRRLTPNVLTLALVAGCAAPAAGHRQDNRPRPATQAAAAPAPQRPPVLVERDPEDGTTTFKLEPFAVEDAKGARSPLLLAAHARRGADPAGGATARAAAPEFVNLTLLSRSPQCRFPEKAELELALDGVPVMLKFQPASSTTATTATMEVVTVFVPKAEGVLWVQSGAEEGGDCAESLAAALSPQTFNRLASARAVSLRVGKTVFALKPAAVAALRDLGVKMKIVAGSR